MVAEYRRSSFAPMSSAAYTTWTGQGMMALSQVPAAHAAVGGTGPGRRTATQQLNHAYAVLLMAQFQGFSRDLHTEAMGALTAAVQPPRLASVILAAMSTSRALDRGNASAGNIGSDFSRLGFDVWPAVYQHDSRNIARREKLDTLAPWRNAMSHHDFTHAELAGRNLSLDVVESWLSACRGLAFSLDIVVGNHVGTLTGRDPR